MLTILLILPCAIISQTTNPIDSTWTVPIDGKIWFLKSQIVKYQPLTIQPEQVFNVYVGLNQGEQYRINYEKCFKAATELNNLIQQQKTEIKEFLRQQAEKDAKLNELQEDRIKSAVKIEKLENKKTPWYKHPILYFALGVGTGIYIAK